MKPKDFIWGNTSWEHFCNRLGAGSLNHWSLLRTIFGLKVAHRFSFDRVFLQGSTFLPPIRWTLKFWEVYLGRLDEDGFAIFLTPIRWTLKFWEVYLGRLDEDGFAKLTHLPFVLYLGTMVRDGLAHMRGVTWQAVPVSSKQGCVRWKNSDLKFVVCLGTLVQDGLAHMRGVIWRAAPAKFKRGMCVRWKSWGLRFCGVSWNVGSGLAHMRGVIWRAAPAKFKKDVWDENRRVWDFVVYLWNVGSGLAHMRGVICSELFRQSSKQGCVRWTFSDWSLQCVLWRWFRMGWHTCVV